jgi:hypothetical protein
LKSNPTQWLNWAKTDFKPAAKLETTPRSEVPTSVLTGETMSAAGISQSEQNKAASAFG